LKRTLALLCACLLMRAAGAADAIDDRRGAREPGGPHPLLALAREVESKKSALERAGAPPTSDLRSAEHALEQAHPPADDACARTLGASVFADLYVDLAQAREDRRDFGGAAEVYAHAVACTPRSTRILANLAWTLFRARDIAGASAVVQRALAVDPRSVELTRLAGIIDFVQERWADAVTKLRYAAASEPDRMRADHSQLLYWLAQRRAGVAHPEFVARRHTEDWPKELLLFLQDQYTEAELVFAVNQGDEEYANVGRNARLCKALYYVGETYWAQGHPDIARDYFAAAVNLKLIDQEEHSLALAEIAKLLKR